MDAEDGKRTRAAGEQKFAEQMVFGVLKVRSLAGIPPNTIHYLRYWLHFDRPQPLTLFRFLFEDVERNLRSLAHICVPLSSILRRMGLHSLRGPGYHRGKWGKPWVKKRLPFS